MIDDDSLVRQQIEYYRARAPEYDQWFLRTGRYDRGEEHRRYWFADVDELHSKLASERPRGDVLELACGTGLWTQHLARHAKRVAAVDISSEAMAINRKRVADDRVDYVIADLFTWGLAGRFDFVFFSFWLSHVPPSRFNNFWNVVHDALRPNAKVFFIDSLLAKESTARDHDPLERDGRAVRKLNDGREFEIVKIFYDPAELERRLKQMGWDGYVRKTTRFFLYGCVSRS